MSSSKKIGGSKITLGMLKGKPITTSVPAFAIRFNAEDEELEALYMSPEEPEENTDCQDDLSVSSHTTSRSSTPHNTASSRDPSPMKESVHKVTKRSASLDESSPGGSDTWRILHELKGKITKTVEEKISEIKNEKKGGRTTGGDRSKLSASKDSSSISDSEECIGTEKSSDLDESLLRSPSRRSTVPNTPENTTPEPEFALEEASKLNESTVIENDPTPSPRKTLLSLRNRIRPKLSELRHRKKKITVNEEGTSVSMSNIGQDESGGSDEFEVIDEEEVESAMEVQEEVKASILPGVVSKPRNYHWSLLIHLQQLLQLPVVQTLLLWPLVCSLLSVSTFVRDVVLGAILMHAAHLLYKWLTETGPIQSEPILIPDYSSLPILQVPAAKEYQPLNRFEGWMNELPDDYDPETYHISQTRSVYIRLEGSTLRTSLTRQKVRKRAMWNETNPRLTFYNQRIYDIAGCVIKLLPEKLARKRLWSKKYPICIILKKDSRVCIEVPETFKDAIEENVEEDGLILEDGEPEGTRDEENSEDDTFCLVTSSMVEQDQLVLFARTDREKDDWIRRLVAATKVRTTPEPEEATTPGSIPEVSETESIISSVGGAALEPPVGTSSDAEFQRHMSRFFQQKTPPPAPGSSPASAPGSPVHGKEDPPADAEDPPSPELHSAPDTAWCNALLGRILFDVLRDKQWSNWTQDKIQRKLSTIKLPSFMEELTVSELDLGTAVPLVQRTSSPHMDERGLWVDLDVSYEGSASISVETKLNLVKLTKADSVESNSSKEGSASLSVPVLETKTISRSPMYDSDMEDSAESSSDEETPEVTADESSSPGPSGGSMGKMLVRMATKITTSRYFQQASEIRYIRRAMEEMSNTRVMVTVELKELVGVLAVNIPPPPSDRIWYGFRGNPQLRLAAKAKLGERLVTLSQVTDWIEKKLCVEFQKVFVLPNMDELIIPVMSSKLPE